MSFSWKKCSFHHKFTLSDIWYDFFFRLMSLDIRYKDIFPNELMSNIIRINLLNIHILKTKTFLRARERKRNEMNGTSSSLIISDHPSWCVADFLCVPSLQKSLRSLQTILQIVESLCSHVCFSSSAITCKYVVMQSVDFVLISSLPSRASKENCFIIIRLTLIAVTTRLGVRLFLCGIIDGFLMGIRFLRLKSI